MKEQEVQMYYLRRNHESTKLWYWIDLSNKGNTYPSVGNYPEGHQLRPDVVWFGEDVPNLLQGAEIIKNADILIIVGTSLQVYPAATLIHYTKEDCTVYIVDPNTIPKLDSHIHLRIMHQMG